MRKSVLILCLLAACLLDAHAQFYLNGDDPARLRWFSIETAHYQLIFPEGTDSLARVYARSLEQFRVPLGCSLGDMTPGEGDRRKMPVVLHTHYPYSNGSVGWAPRRYDLYTHPESTASDPVPWYLQLAGHEPRHQAQLQFGQRSFVSWFTGEIWAPVYWQVFLEQAYGEGDAVVAETGVLGGSRARTADFLNFYRIALDQGDYRSWDRWRYGSYKHYTPDHYALGYVTVAGARTLYDSPLLMREAQDLAWKKPWYIAPFNNQKVIRELAGKPFKQAFRDILDQFNSTWQADAEARGPFMSAEAVTPAEAYATTYRSPQWIGNGFLALRESYLRPTELIWIMNGDIHRLRAFSGSASPLAYDPVWNRVFWSEIHNDPRWSLAGTSVICYYDLNTSRLHQMTRGTRYYNPQCSPDGTQLIAVEFAVNGECALVVLDVESGATLERYLFPSGVQPASPAWVGEREFYMTGITAEGFGLYHLLSDGTWETVLAPTIQKIKTPRGGKDYLEWVSDRSGVNELYRFYPASRRLEQWTNSRYGGEEYCADEKYLYYTAQTLEGVQLFRTPLQELQPREVSFADVYRYAIADEITAQERALGAIPDLEKDVPVSEPQAYSKLAHPLRLHSWLPLYVNYDNVKSGSMDFSYETASIGLSGFFQNTLGTFSGMLGYAFHPDPDREKAWRSALHLKLVYSGLYPIFEASVDVGDHLSRQYIPRRMNDGGRISYQTAGVVQSAPQVYASLKTYLPLSFSRSGRYFGVTPQLSYSVSNSSFSLEPLEYSVPKRLKELPAYYRLASPTITLDGPLTQHVSASVRGYLMKPRARSQVYPRLGIGLEGGVGFRPGLARYYAPNLYGYAYGYLPGFTRAQGLRWSLMGQLRTQNDLLGELLVNTLPRGFDSEARSLVAQYFPRQWKVTADYAIPIYVGDLSIPGVAYIKNFLLTPHADYTALPYDSHDFNLWSVGADLSASLARLFVLPFDASIGVSFSYLGGSLAPYLELEKPYSVSLLFGVDF